MAGIYTDQTDLIGQKFLRLTVLSVDRHLCQCLCDCGNQRTLRVKLLGKTISCGCARREANKSRKLNLLGQVFGRLTVVEETRLPDGGHGWLCVCECGKEVVYKGSALNSGNNRSCGCLWKDACKTQVENIARARRLAKGLPEDFLMSNHNRIEREKTKPLVRRILSRDEEYCAWCSIQREEKTIEVHHLVPWSESEELRFSERNLVSLCRDCHWKIHQNNMRGPVDASMTILLQGFANYQEDLIHGLL